jgi:uncharacterized protein YndB with AHSA1/START domain
MPVADRSMKPEGAAMKWLLILAPIVIGFVAAVSTVGIGGMLLPKAHTATRSVRLSRPPEAVWAIITDFERHPSWRPGLKSIERLPDSSGRPVWREVDKHGQAIPIEIVESTPPRRMVGRIADPKLPFGGTWTYDLAPDGAGTRLRITEDGEVYNPVFRYISRIIGHAATIEGYLRALGNQFGDEARIEP